MKERQSLMVQVRKALDRTFSTIKPYLTEAFLSDLKLISTSPQPEWIRFANCEINNSSELITRAGNDGTN